MGGTGAEGVWVVLVTHPASDGAKALARQLVSEQLAACVNVVPGISSIYRWQGAVHEDAEVLLVIKTSEARLAALRARILALHPYEVPEVIALPVAFGSDAYLSWVLDVTR